MEEISDTPLDLKLVADTIAGHGKFVVSTHVNPDGDAVGSALAMAYALEQLGKDIVIVHEQGTPPIYPFLGQSNWLTSVPDDISERCAIAVDSASRERVAADDRLEEAKTVINIDHHASNTRFGQLNWVQADAAATCEMLPALFDLLGVSLDERIAAAVYTGVYTDTGGLKFSNTSEVSRALLGDLEARFDLEEVVAELDFKPESWKLYSELAQSRLTDHGNGITSIVMTADDLRSCGVADDEDKHAKDYALSMLYDPSADRDLLIFCYELKDGSRLVSLRSNQISSAEIAQEFSGGGHQAAAGYNAPGDAVETVEAAVAAARRQLELRAPDINLSH